jgi:ribonuclease D
MIPSIITSTEDLERFVDMVKDSQWLAIDTEFIRESTYYAKLCLVQIATQDVSVCIDVLRLDDHDALKRLLASSQIKIFHSARQDIEVLKSEYNIIPTPLFDTQIAASILGLNEQISYAELVSQTLAIHLPKTESRTDWSRRPLTSAQIDYALDDVNHLGALYDYLKQALQEKQRIHWLDEECAYLTNPAIYEVHPDQAWQQVKGIGRATSADLGVIQALAAWRELTAIKKNLPRRWVLNDQCILECAQHKPRTVEQTCSLLRQHAPKSIRQSDAIYSALEQAYNVEKQLTMVDRRLDKQQQELVKKMMKVTRAKSEQIGTSPSLLANRKSIVKLVLGEDCKITSGWRHSEIGTELMRMLD